MEPKLVVFVVLASVTLNSVIWSSAESHSSPDENCTDFDDIRYNYNEAVWNVSHGISTLFDIAEKLLTEEYLNHSYSYKNITSPLPEGLGEVNNAVTLVFNTVSLAITDCDTIQYGRPGTEYIAYDPLTQYDRALDWANGGGASTNPKGIENYRNAAISGWQRVIEKLFVVIRNCTYQTSDQVKSLVQATENATLANAIEASNLAMDAIQIYGDAVAGATLDNAALTSIRYSRRDAILADLRSVQNVFSLYKTMHINSCLNGTGIVDKMFAIVLAEMRAAHTEAEMTKIVFTRIKDSLDRLFDTSEDNGASDIFIHDVTEAGAIAAIMDGYGILLDSVELTQPSSSTNVTIARALARLTVPGIVRSYYVAISIAEDKNLPDPIGKWAIEVLENITNTESKNVVESVFELISNNASIAARIESSIEEVQQQALENAQKGNSLILKAGQILAEAYSGTAVLSPQDVFASMRALQQLAIEAFDRYVGIIYKASLLEVLASN